MRIAVFGGSFDPPHIGHMMACYYILATTDIQKIWLVPSYRHPFGKESAPYDMRVRMCEISSEIFKERVEVKRFEEEMGEGSSGPVYTIDLLKYLSEKFTSDRFYFVIGSDILAEAEKWKDFDRIENYARLLILRRRGVDPAEDYKAVLPDVSSSLIRENIKKSIPVSGLLCNDVIRFIEENNLYR
ncbi:MAG: nicotinate (nicotinamide) nucleotide adenylyltransferase [Deltaproteobacteria bacterium]|nr:nicotinate (nicotinamide) nucleotide adenylyltransferase [Deltaproteobacteria bacterium]